MMSRIVKIICEPHFSSRFVCAMTKIANASTILLLEDEPRVACALAHMITTLGHAIIQVNDVKLA